MYSYPILPFRQSVVLIGYSKSLKSAKIFKEKCDQVIDTLKDFLVISVDDSNGFIAHYYSDHILEKIFSVGIKNTQIEKIYSKCSHVIVFWDGEDLSDFVFHALRIDKPCKIIPVLTTKVRNKDRDEEFDIYIGRRSPWGNPFVIGKDGNRDEVIAKFKTYFYESLLTDPQKAKAILGLKGKRLGCHCKPFACHGDVIAEYLDNLDSNRG